MPQLLSSTIRCAVGILDQFARPRLSVLIFHRVTPEPDPLFPREMHARRFDRLMNQVSRVFNVLTIAEAHSAFKCGKLPARSLAITFDDGYADNAEIALPILRRYGLRATFFVSTGFLNGRRMWNDSVIELLRRSPRSEIDVSFLGCGVLPLGNADQKRAAIDKLLPIIKYMSLSERAGALDSLSKLCGAPSMPDNLMMSTEQVRELHLAGMEIGGHTVNHPILAAIEDDDSRHEIASGRSELERIIGSKVSSFAYPNGGPIVDYDGRHMEMVRQAGFSCAVTTAVGSVGPYSDPMQWARFTPWDLDDRKWLVRLAIHRYRSSTEVGV